VKLAGKFAKGKHKLLNGLTNHGKQSQPVDIQDLPVSEMERRLDAMSAFMARTQVELAASVSIGEGEVTPPGGTNGGVAAGGGGQKAFEEMSSMEMADVLSREIERWKTLYGTEVRAG
jgi:hypothetical protein